MILKFLLIPVFLGISATSYAAKVDVGPQTISPTGELWVCVSQTSDLKTCEDEGAICQEFEKIMVVLPKVRMSSKKPKYVRSNESCARLY